jgi:glycosyltransferase involved in cell wall biosynthesis
MRITYISKSIIPSRTANSIHVMKMCQAFADNGHEVVLLAPDSKNEYEKDINDIYDNYGVRKNFKIKKLYHPDIKGGVIIYTLAIFFYLLINKKFDLVYGRFLHGIYVATLLNNKVVYETHAPLLDRKSHRQIIFKRLVKSKYFKKMVVISQALKNIYLDRGYLQDSKIQVAHDGADTVENFNHKIDLLGSKDNLKVGYTGHLYKGKGMEVIASMADKLDEDVEIHIIGGLEKDIKFWKNKILRKNIYFYGFVPHKKVSSYINALDICLLPNQKIVSAYGSNSSNISLNISSYTSPLKLFEYMSHKKPIIASDLPVIREVLNERNSILVKHDDIELWISSIKKLKNFEYRETISNKSLSDFTEYTWKNRAMRLIENV